MTDAFCQELEATFLDIFSPLTRITPAQSLFPPVQSAKRRRTDVPSTSGLRPDVFREASAEMACEVNTPHAAELDDATEFTPTYLTSDRTVPDGTTLEQLQQASPNADSIGHEEADDFEEAHIRHEDHQDDTDTPQPPVFFLLSLNYVSTCNHSTRLAYS
eukprot:m.171632 g.171632  ORF g.171632 m.171632 type:complete len:160 (+) comp53267_c0_seq21:724-1203(+)